MWKDVRNPNANRTPKTDRHQNLIVSSLPHVPPFHRIENQLSMFCIITHADKRRANKLAEADVP